MARLPAPEETESRSVPADQGIRLHECQSSLPGEESAQDHQGEFRGGAWAASATSCAPGREPVAAEGIDSRRSRQPGNEARAAINSPITARAIIKDRATRLSCGDDVDVEALVRRYCNAIPHVYSNFSGAQVVKNTCFGRLSKLEIE